MNISAVMNIHEIAANKAVTKWADSQSRQNKANTAANIQKPAPEEKAEKNSPLEAYPALFANSVQQKDDPQAVSTRVERQMETQGTKQAVAHAHATNQKLGTLVDIIT